ncbi:MAG: heme exporter protein CcmB [Anaerolineales bacterium]|nr:heme exporter protein CcmB [Anaerolineales bacterium]
MPPEPAELAPPTTAAAAAAGPTAHFRHFLRTMGAIVWKDLATEFRSKELLSAMVVFALLMILIFNFALELDRAARENVTAGVLWVTTIFTGTLGLNRSLAAEKDRGSLDGLLLAPIDRSALYFGKALGNLLFILVVEAVLLPVFGVLFNMPVLRPLLLLVLLLGTLGYAAVGTLLASLAVYSRSRDVMLPILLFPVAIPLLVAGVRASSGILAGVEWVEIGPWFNILIGYDLLFVAAAFMLFEYVVEE